MIRKKKDNPPEQPHVTISSIQPEHVPALAAMQRIVFQR